MIVKSDKRSGKIILEKIEKYAEYRKGNFDVKVLKGKYGILKRLRVGKYRVIFEEKDDLISIYEVKHRQGVYND